MYHLPLLPGYGPNTSVRSSAAPVTEAKSLQTRFAEAEENGYQGSYFAPQEDPPQTSDGYMTSGSHGESRRHPPHLQASVESEAEVEAECVDEGGQPYAGNERRQETREMRPQQLEGKEEDRIAEVVFFAYGVTVFFGLDEGQERAIVEDISNAGILKRPMREDDWEIEECHFAVRPVISAALRLTLFSMIQQYHTHAYIMISLVRFSNCAFHALLKQHKSSVQVSLPSTQAICRACPRPVHAPRTLRVCCFFCAFLTQYCLDTTTARVFWSPQSQTQ
jgi:hypothetical protein